MIEYNLLSRNVSNPEKFKTIRDERIIMKANKDPRQEPRKVVLNGSYGASKDRYNNLYDPLQANNVCIYGQLLLTDLLDKVYGKCEIINSNTDGILVKLYKKEDRQMIMDICEEWSKRTRMDLDYDDYVKVIQKDVNNYILVDKDGHVKRKGSYVKKLSLLDNDLPVVNKAIVDYFVHHIPVETTVNNATDLISFQKISKIGRQYDYVFKESSNDPIHNFTKYKTKTKKGVKYKVSIDENINGIILPTRVNRCFASKLKKDGSLYKKKNDKTSLDKIGGTPDSCFIDNNNILDKKIPNYLDRQWYIDLAYDRINDFLGKN